MAANLTTRRRNSFQIKFRFIKHDQKHIMLRMFRVANEHTLILKKLRETDETRTGRWENS